MITCMLKNTVTLMAAIAENSLEEFAERLQEHMKFSAKQNVLFKNMLLKLLDFDRLIANFLFKKNLNVI